MGLFVLIGLALAAVAFWLAASSLQRKKRAQQAEAVLHGDFSAVLLEVLANAARIDGRLHETEREAMESLMSEATGAPFERARIDAALENAKLSREQLVAYLAASAATLSTDQKSMLLKGVLTVAAADGQFHHRERDIYLDYMAALGFARQTAPEMLQEWVENSVSQKYV